MPVKNYTKIKLEKRLFCRKSFENEISILLAAQFFKGTIYSRLFGIWFVAADVLYWNCMNLSTLGNVCFYFFKGSWTGIQYESYKRDLEAREDKCVPCDTEQHIWKVILYK